MSELTGHRIRVTAARLGLPHLAEALTDYIRRADEGKLGYLDLMDLVLSEELAIRDDRRYRQGLRLSRLPHHKTLEDYDFAFQPELEPRKVKDLATLAFVEAKANVALLGPPGVGKTHIAVALAVAACRAGYSIYFTTLDDMVRNLKTAETAGRLVTKLASYVRPSVLVVDEVGYQPLERAEAHLVFQVISKRYEKDSIILTSNKSFGEWGQVFGDEVLATAILDRLLHHCDVISINGPSYRLKNRLRALDGESGTEWTWGRSSVRMWGTARVPR
ncbi:IS21-like element helper ATPase IstB [Streptomyces melanogenes]|uniref:IS21-like element helper ATPase IstB n=1 Tax=Streptomyces melanogenes TaxID=67326 RepID=UPI0037BAB47E